MWMEPMAHSFHGPCICTVMEDINYFFPEFVGEKLQLIATVLTRKKATEIYLQFKLVFDYNKL